MGDYNLIIGLVIGLGIGLFMYQDAKKRKLDNPSVWIWVGLIFSVFGLITYYFWHMRPKTGKK